MGRQAKAWQAGHPGFRDKVRSAILDLAETDLGNADPNRKQMARVLLHENTLETIVLPDMLMLLAQRGLDVDSADTAIETAVEALVPLMIVKTNADLRP